MKSSGSRRNGRDQRSGTTRGSRKDDMGGFSAPSRTATGNGSRGFHDSRRPRDSVLRYQGGREVSTEDRRGHNMNRGGKAASGKTYGVGFREVEELSKLLSEKKLLVGSGDILTKVGKPSMFYRMNDLWKNPEKDDPFLRLIVAAASTNEFSLRTLTHDFLSRILETRLIPSLTEEYVLPLMHDSSKRTHKHSVLLENMATLLFLLIEREPSASDKFLSEMLAFQSVFTRPDIRSSECFSSGLEKALERFQNQFDARTKEKLEMAKGAKKPVKRTGDEQMPPPDDFREISVEPSKADMLLSGKPYLRRNLKQGSYDDDEHYLDVQFRLLREDFLQPLRDAVNRYRTGGAKNTDLYVYTEVKVDPPELDKKTGEMICTTHFKRRRCRWLRQMIYGSLVCLSSDDFGDSFIFGTVFERTIEGLKKGSVCLLFTRLDCIDYSATYKMIESSAYYESYHPVLRGLQAFRKGERVPFSRYLVSVKTDPVPPEYLSGIDFIVDFSSICGSRTDRLPIDDLVVDAREAHKKLSKDLVQLDTSQHEALTMTFQQDLVIIQGPPGTGKTHVGLKIASVLLDNQHRWNRHKNKPLLVVCYTNHALDQFLLGILRILQNGYERKIALHAKNSGRSSDSVYISNYSKQVDLVRIGSRSRCPEMEEYTLNAMRQNNPMIIPGELKHRIFEARCAREKVMKQITEMSKLLKILRSNIAYFDVLTHNRTFLNESVIPKILEDQFREEVYKRNENVGIQSLRLLQRKIFVDWLTVNPDADDEHPPMPRIEMDLIVIEQLMEIGFPELFAKNLSIISGNNVDRAVEWYEQHRSDADIENFVNRSLQEARRWPTIADVREVMGKCDVLAQDAIETLIANQGNPNAAIKELKERKWKLEVGAEGAIAAEDEDNFDEALAEYQRENEWKTAFDYDEDVSVSSADEKIEEGWETTKKGKKMKSAIDNEIQKFRKRILATKPCTEEDEAMVTNVFSLPQQERWKLYMYWADKLSLAVEENLKKLEQRYCQLSQRMKEIRQLSDTELLRCARVIGVTTTGAARLSPVLKSVQCPIVIIEEAAEVLEAHILTSLTVNCQHVILIGDHKQLRPNPAVYKLAKDFDLDVSLFERLINNGFPYVTLTKQHRMRREIARTLMPHFYPKVEDDPSVFQYPPVKGMTKNLFFIKHDFPENVSEEQRSHKNEFEVKYTVYLARYLLQQAYQPEQVTILCAYMEQMISTRLLANEILGKDHSVRIEVIDNYQGEECEIVILSLVRSHNPSGTIGFLSVPNRVCVALSRAKIGLYCVANVDYLASKCMLWDDIRSSLLDAEAIGDCLEIRCQNHGIRQIIDGWEAFNRLAPEGGCFEPCDLRLNCGHVCKKRCHVTSHDMMRCMESCTRKCPFGHPCRKRCFENCGECKQIVVKKLPCGHDADVACSVPAEDFKNCSYECERILLCGHRCAAVCSSPCTTSCEVVIQRELPCGHLGETKCFEDILFVKCNQTVKKVWPGCGHEVTTNCFMDPVKHPCPHPCGTPLPGCEHICKGTCGLCRMGRLHLRCMEDCKRVLVCGHICESKCSRVCPPCKKPCEAECFHSRCGFGGTTEKKFRKADRSRRKKKEGRICGELCPPCVEPCANRCEHRACELLCHLPCEIEPCNEPCKIKQKCDHRCIGMCGEICPDVCEICTPEEFAEATETFFGFEKEEGARFLQLDGCKHIVEVQGMDNWVNTSCGIKNEEGESRQSAIMELVCPKCKTTVKRCRRYQRIINQRALDIAAVKTKIMGKSAEELDMERKSILADLEGHKELLENCAGRSVPLLSVFSLETVVDKLIEPVEKRPACHLTTAFLTTFENLSLITEELMLIANSIERNFSLASFINGIELSKMHETCVDLFGGKSSTDFIKEEWEYLCTYIIEKMDDISPLMVEQLASEVLRFRKLVDVAKVLKKMIGNGVTKMNDKEIDALQTLQRLLNGNQNIDDDNLKKIDGSIRLLRDGRSLPGLGITERERISINKALGNDVTQWYKCSNGHVYGIGNCGQPMELSVCPECKESIGGNSHRLVSTSAATAVMRTGRPAQ